MRVRKRKPLPAGKRWLVWLVSAPAAVVVAESKREAIERYPVGIAHTEHSIKARRLGPKEVIKTDKNGIVEGSIPEIPPTDISNLADQTESITADYGDD